MRRIEGVDKVAGSLVITQDMALAGLADARLIRLHWPPPNILRPMM